MTLLGKAILLQNDEAPTKRALDAGNSAAFSSIFLASSFFCSQAEPTPAPAPVKQAVTPRCEYAESNPVAYRAAFEIIVRTASDPSILGMASHLLYVGRNDYY